MSKSFYRNAQIVILVYDITVTDSFNEIKKYWYPTAKEEANENAIMVLVGNKEDLLEIEYIKEEVDEITAREYAEEIGALYFKISVKNHEKVVDLFEEIVKKYIGPYVEKNLELEKQENEESQKNHENLSRPINKEMKNSGNKIILLLKWSKF